MNRIAAGIRADAYELVRGYAAPGYGLPNPGMIEAVKLMASLEGILLGPGLYRKAMAGLIDMVRTGQFGKTKRWCSSIPAARRPYSRIAHCF